MKNFLLGGTRAGRRSGIGRFGEYCGFPWARSAYWQSKYTLL